MDVLAAQYLKSPYGKQALAIMHKCRTTGNYQLGCFFGEYFVDIYPFNRFIMDEYGICLFYIGENSKSHEIFQKIIALPNLEQNDLDHYVFNDHFNHPKLIGTFSHYDEDKVKKIMSRRQRGLPLITLSMTSCKRLNLFIRTVNSFINCCLDCEKIDRWICVDDNSSEEDRKTMQDLYPFFTFIFKDEKDKGHPRSMNLIRENCETPYLCHLEDDWEFFIPRPYLSDAIEILSQEDSICQCLFNHNYRETTSDIIIRGGFKCSTRSGLNYYLHEHCTDDKFKRKHGNVINCAYWPHYSFRPSVIKTSIFQEIGPYSDALNFEIEYAFRYVKEGYHSAFFPGIQAVHIGRLTTERNDTSKENAYSLNNFPQFIEDKAKETEPAPEKEETEPAPEKEEIIEKAEKTWAVVVNLDKREDRLKTFEEKIQDVTQFKIERFSAINGYSLKPNLHLSKLFDGNDYNMRKGMVGCALSHIKIMIDFLETDKEFCLVLEDDAEPVPDFEAKLVQAIKKLPEDCDLFYLGHHLKSQYKNEKTYRSTGWSEVFKWSRKESLQKSLGGTFGYLISRKGASGLLDYIDSRGMTNGIDTVQQKAGDVINLYYCEPMLVHSVCCQNNQEVDSDIQYNYDSLTIPLEERISLEFDFLSKLKADTKLSKDYKEVNKLIEEGHDAPIIYDSREDGGLLQLLPKFKSPYYLLEGKVICAFPQKICGEIYSRRSLNRLKWLTNESICYKIEPCIEYKGDESTE